MKSASDGETSRYQPCSRDARVVGLHGSRIAFHAGRFSGLFSEDPEEAAIFVHFVVPTPSPLGIQLFHRQRLSVDGRFLVVTDRRTLTIVYQNISTSSSTVCVS
jgi:hypothetical protein